MKQAIYILTIILLSGNVFSQDKQQLERQKVLKVLEDQRRAWNSGNIEEYMHGYWKSDSLLFVGKSGPRYGWQNTLQSYKKAYPDKAAMGYLSFNILKVNFIDNIHVFVLGRWHIKREKDEPQGYFTLMLQKLDGEWKVVSDHSS